MFGDDYSTFLTLLCTLIIPSVSIGWFASQQTYSRCSRTFFWRHISSWSRL